VLFGNANGPGNPQVQAILKALPDGPANLARDIDSTVTTGPRPALVVPLWSVRSREENSCGLGYRLYLQSWAGDLRQTALSRPGGGRRPV